MINWDDPDSQVTAHFRVKECSKFEIPDEIADNLVKTCELMEKVRLALNESIVVHSMHRTVEYNKDIGGASNSAHIEGLACDFSTLGYNCDEIRQVLMSYLDEWDCRMEDNPGSDWVHLDLRKVPEGGNRFFKP